jgi:hypothetical protein
MSFEPESEREVPEVRGTIWLDARTFELRLVEFRYSRLPSPSGNRNIGGEVHFTRLPSGAWIVERWFIRIPRYARSPTIRSSGVPGVAPEIQYRLTPSRLGQPCRAACMNPVATPPRIARTNRVHAIQWGSATG